MADGDQQLLTAHFTADQSDLDLVGIGALNLDYIADASASTRSDLAASPVLRDRLGSPLPFEPGVETLIDEETVQAVLAAVNPAVLSASLGGSAFNTIDALAHLGLPFNLGYLGIAGKAPLSGLSSVRQLTDHGVDVQGIASTQHAFCGVCLSFPEQGERTLLTHPGANERMGPYLETYFTEALRYLTRARIVHLTSFLDTETPGHLVRLIKALKQSKPAVLVSFDPGHVWAVQRTPETLALAAMSDLLFLNDREFRALADAHHGETDDAVALRLLEGGGPGMVVIVKRPDGVVLFGNDNGALDRTFCPQEVLYGDEIQDATGAGDVFAAGLLAVAATPGLELSFGARLGLVLARHTLGHVGSAGHADFAKLTGDVVGSEPGSGGRRDGRLRRLRRSGFFRH